MALGSNQPLKEMPVRRADNLATLMCRLSENLGASTSWNPQGLLRPVMGLLYLLSFLSCLTKRLRFRRVRTRVATFSFVMCQDDSSKT
jgi:hypothetical protein